MSARELRELARLAAVPALLPRLRNRLAPAVPIFAGTRPFEALPFQWSCHIETSRGRARACGVPRPRRGAADAPARRELARDARHDGPDPRLHAVRAARAARACGALPATSAAALVALDGAHRRSASGRRAALLPSRDAGLVVDQGRAADRRAGLELRARSAPSGTGLRRRPRTSRPSSRRTPDARRAALRRALLDYCRQDTLALVRLVEFFGRWIRLAASTRRSRFAMRAPLPLSVARRARRRGLAPESSRASRVRDRVRRRPHGRGQRRSHARLVAEPAHPLRRRDEDAGRHDAELGAAAARQPADVSARELDRADDPGRLRSHGHAATSGATTRRSSTRPASTSAPDPRKAAQLGRCANSRHRHADDGRPERRLHRDRPTTTRSTSRATGTTATDSKSPSTTSSRSRCR